MKALLFVLLAVGAAVAYAQIGVSPPPTGRFQIVAATDGGAWRLDTSTGAVSKCSGSSAEVRCSGGGTVEWKDLKPR